jgi:hypothetical protein
MITINLPNPSSHSVSNRNDDQSEITVFLLSKVLLVREDDNLNPICEPIV